MDEVKTLSAAITFLFASFGKDTEKERKKIYGMMLRDLPPELIISVIKKCVEQSKYFPSVAELREAAQSLVNTMQGKNNVPDWGEAWSEIEKAMYSTPWGKKPKFSHPAITKTVEYYGWHALQTCLSEDLNVIRAQIRRIYDDTVKRYVETKHNMRILADNPSLQESEILKLDKAVE